MFMNLFHPSIGSMGDDFPWPWSSQIRRVCHLVTLKKMITIRLVPFLVPQAYRHHQDSHHNVAIGWGAESNHAGLEDPVGVSLSILCKSSLLLISTT